MKAVHRLFLIIGIFVLFPNAKASPLSWSHELGAELGSLAIFQESGGSTLTALPLLHFRFLHWTTFTLTAQTGITALRSTTYGRNIFASFFRIAPNWTNGSQRFSLELPIGIQWWERGGTKTDVGLRAIISLSPTYRFMDEFIIGGGSISNRNTPTFYLNAGVRKWF